jgi:hypothetical protein
VHVCEALDGRILHAAQENPPQIFKSPDFGGAADHRGRVRRRA